MLVLGNAGRPVKTSGAIPGGRSLGWNSRSHRQRQGHQAGHPGALGEDQVRHRQDGCGFEASRRLARPQAAFRPQGAGKNDVFFNYVCQAYPPLTPFLKGFHLTIAGLREDRDEYGWRMCNNLAKDKLLEEHDDPAAPREVTPVPRFRSAIEVLKF
jgi:hypothetical protein